MSESAKNIIKFFCDRFLNIDYYPTSLKAILDLPLDKLKKVKQEEIDKFEKIKIKTLRDVNTLDADNIGKLSRKLGIDEATIRNAIIAAYLIANAWNKRKLYLKKKQTKVVISGLDYAGKTSLINRLMSDQTYGAMTDIEPTRGANIEEFQSDRANLLIWDLGGQKNHIEEYLSEPEKFFIQVDVLIFVIDTQDDKRYDNAIKYLSDIMRILEFLNESPFLLVLLNKADADLYQDPDFQIKLEYLFDKVQNLFLNRDKEWNIEIIPTSIYNFYSKEPEIARSIKDIFTKEHEPKKDETMVSIEDKLKSILEINLNLLDRVVSELAEIKRVLGRLTPADFSKSLFSIPFERVPSDYISEKAKIEAKKKRKSKKEAPNKKNKKNDEVAGPPKKLNAIPEPKIQDKEEKNKTQQPREIEKSMEKSLGLDGAVSVSDITSLRPPLPPKAVPTPNIGVTKPSRMEIISELKEIFIKRGIVR